MEYSDFFQKGTGSRPFAYQDRLATLEKWPDVIEAPTGAGKTAAVVMAWLWRSFVDDKNRGGCTPRRLVYCLPMRVLVEQTLAEVEKWLKATGLDDRVSVSVLMGGEDAGDWHLHPERRAILIGTQDMLISRMLNRGYGASRFRWPIDFGLLSNDCLWVFDEVQLMGSGLATTAQMEAFRHSYGTFADCHSIWMSATIMPQWLATADFRPNVSNLLLHQIDSADRNGALKRRLEARKTLKRCEVDAGDFKKLAHSVLDAHVPGTLTLVVLNKVHRAVDLYRAFKQASTDRKKGPHRSDGTDPTVTTEFPELILLHSRFRPIDRREKIVRLLDSDIPEAGVIAVTTQVVEAGVNVSAKNLFTDLAPWPSLVQRFGRCNRKGEYPTATCHWIDILRDGPGEDLEEKKRIDAARPYEVGSLITAQAELEALQDVSIQSLERHLEALDDRHTAKLFPYEPQHVIRKKDLIELFDTTPDLAGNDADISRFIRDGEDLDVQVFWRDVPEEGPSAGEERPAREEVCAVQVTRFRDFCRNKNSYRWDHLANRWMRVRIDGILPGRIFLIPRIEGGYDLETGWDLKHKGPVKIVEQDLVKGLPPEANDDDQNSLRSHWEPIGQHADQVSNELAEILKQLAIALPQKIQNGLARAARKHDWGKVHEVFVNAFDCRPPDPNKHWAKVPKMKRYGRPGFRHELAGALAMLQAGESPLACYLVASHHGKVRLSIRSLPTESRPPEAKKRFARGIWDGDVLPSVNLGGGVVTEETVLSLEPMELGSSTDGKPSWAQRMLELRDDPHLGPFRLTFLEALLRAADVLASKSGTNSKTT
ncbi:MAG: CRISPR-associated helicase Cas3' [Pseudomonadota bacterium]